jgi:hypothetical protein
METSNQKKNRLLGEPYGTATNRLRKMLLFDFAKRCGEDICYRCGTRIETIGEFSIEHTIPWQGTPNPKETFFDLAKIAFSHLSCNVGAGEKRYKVYNSPQETKKAAKARARNDPARYRRELDLKIIRYHNSKT